MPAGTSIAMRSPRDIPVNPILHTPSRPSWFQTPASRLAPPRADSALVSGVVARGRRAVHGVLFFTLLPQLWFQDDDDAPDAR